MQLKKQAEKPKSAKNKKFKMSVGDGPLIDYCTEKRYTQSWMDVVKSLDEITTMTFSINAGVKLSLPVQQKAVKHPQADKQDSNTDSVHNARSRR